MKSVQNVDDEIVFRDNQGQRSPCMIVLDISGSMTEPTTVGGRRRIDELNAGLERLTAALREDDVARSQVQICIVTAGGPRKNAEVALPWTDVESFIYEPFEAEGPTPLGRALLLALDELEANRSKLKGFGINYTRPWMFVITDGQATDPEMVWREAVQRMRAAEEKGRCIVYPIAVDSAHVVMLSQISTTRVAMMESANFPAFFTWLAASLPIISRSTTGDDIQLPPTDVWARLVAN